MVLSSVVWLILSSGFKEVRIEKGSWRRMKEGKDWKDEGSLGIVGIEEKFRKMGRAKRKRLWQSRRHKLYQLVLDVFYE